MQFETSKEDPRYILRRTVGQSIKFIGLLNSNWSRLYFGGSECNGAKGSR